MGKRGLAVAAVAVAVALAAVAAFPPARYFALGKLRGEPSYEGWPAGYWVYATSNGGDAGRAHAAYVLGELGPGTPDAAPTLVAALKDGAPLVRKNAAESLRKFPPAVREAVPTLVGLLKDGDRGVRRAAAIDLGLV